MWHTYKTMQTTGLCGSHWISKMNYSNLNYSESNITKTNSFDTFKTLRVTVIINTSYAFFPSITYSKRNMSALYNLR